MENEGQYGSQAMQDAFASLCNGRKRDGVYVDLGAGHFGNGSNTYRLWKELGWRGIAAEKDAALAELYLRERPDDLFFDDALDPALPAEIVALAGEKRRVDFLSLDLEPPEITLTCLLGLPLDRVRFSVICCEHDVYRRPRAIKDAMRGILEGAGYVRVVEDVRMLSTSERDGRMIFDTVPVEDWWVDPSAVDVRNAAEIGAQLRAVNDENHSSEADRLNEKVNP